MFNSKNQSYIKLIYSIYYIIHNKIIMINLKKTFVSTYKKAK